MADPVIDVPSRETAPARADQSLPAASGPATALPAEVGGAARAPAAEAAKPARRLRSSAADVAREWRWQWVLLPVLVVLILGVTVFFLWATKSQLDALQTQIYSAPHVRLDTVFAVVASQTASWDAAQRADYAQWRTRAELEAFALERRYHQANVMLMVRTWTRYLGFVTGMIMALMGAGFILGKFREAGTALEVHSNPLTASLSSTSPGLILAVLGCALMITTIVVHTDIVTSDTPMYTGSYATPATDAAVPGAYPGGAAQAGATPDEILSRHGVAPAAAADSARAGRPQR